MAHLEPYEAKLRARAREAGLGDLAEKVFARERLSLDDGLELRYGMDPLNPDTDGDGLLDGEDVDFIVNAVHGLPLTDFAPPGAGTQNAMLEKAGVATVAGTSFGIHGEGYIRFSYANSTENIKRAIERVGNLLTG